MLTGLLEKLYFFWCLVYWLFPVFFLPFGHRQTCSFLSSRSDWMCCCCSCPLLRGSPFCDGAARADHASTLHSASSASSSTLFQWWLRLTQPDLALKQMRSVHICFAGLCGRKAVGSSKEEQTGCNNIFILLKQIFLVLVHCNHELLIWEM